MPQSKPEENIPPKINSEATDTSLFVNHDPQNPIRILEVVCRGYDEQRCKECIAHRQQSNSLSSFGRLTIDLTSPAQKLARMSTQQQDLLSLLQQAIQKIKNNELEWIEDIDQVINQISSQSVTRDLITITLEELRLPQENETITQKLLAVLSLSLHLKPEIMVPPKPDSTEKNKRMEEKIKLNLSMDLAEKIIETLTNIADQKPPSSAIALNIINLCLKPNTNIIIDWTKKSTSPWEPTINHIRKWFEIARISRDTFIETAVIDIGFGVCRLFPTLAPHVMKETINLFFQAADLSKENILRNIINLTIHEHDPDMENTTFNNKAMATALIFIWKQALNPENETIVLEAAKKTGLLKSTKDHVSTRSLLLSMVIRDQNRVEEILKQARESMKNCYNQESALLYLDLIVCMAETHTVFFTAEDIDQLIEINQTSQTKKLIKMKEERISTNMAKKITYAALIEMALDNIATKKPDLKSYIEQKKQRTQPLPESDEEITKTLLRSSEEGKTL